jgi:hypothetical protein
MFSTRSFLFSAIGAGTATGQPLAMNTATLAGAFLPNPMMSFLVGQQVARAQAPPVTTTTTPAPPSAQGSAGASGQVAAGAAPAARSPGGTGTAAPPLSDGQKLALVLKYFETQREPVPDLSHETPETLPKRDLDPFTAAVQWAPATSEYADPGEFVSQSIAAGTLAYPGTVITVTFSRGSGFRLPPVGGLDYASLVRAASRYDVHVVRTDLDVPGVEQGYVIDYLSDSSALYYPGDEVRVTVQYESSSVSPYSNLASRVGEP